MWGFLFLLLMISLSQEINVLKKTKNKVFAALSLQGLCSTLTFRLSEHTNHFLLCSFRANVKKKKKKRYLSAGLEMFCSYCKGPVQHKLLHLIGETDGSKQRNRGEIKGKYQQNSYKKPFLCFLKQRVWAQAILHQWGILSFIHESSAGETMGCNKPSLRAEIKAAP